MPGLSAFVKDFNFIASMYLLSVVLPVMTSLSKILQGEKLDFTVVHPSVDGALSTLRSLHTTPGMYKQWQNGKVEKLADFGVKQDEDGALAKLFKERVEQPTLRDSSAIWKTG